MVPASDLLLELSHFLGEKLDRRSALSTHHVMMAAAIVLVFITGDAIMKGNFAGKPATGQKLQRSVDRSETNARVGFLNQPVELINRKMFACFEKGPKNGAALFGLLQADAFEMLMKNALGFADVLPRDSQLIVDSLLQHVGAGTRDDHAPRALPHDTGQWRVTPTGFGRSAVVHHGEVPQNLWVQRAYKPDILQIDDALDPGPSK